jgi:hypothetical protein
MSDENSFSRRLFDRQLDDCDNYGGIAIASCQSFPFDLQLALEIKKRLGYYIGNEKRCGLEVPDLVQALAIEWHRPDLIESECLSILTPRPEGYLDSAVFLLAQLLGIYLETENQRLYSMQSRVLGWNPLVGMLDPLQKKNQGMWKTHMPDALLLLAANLGCPKEQPRRKLIPWKV